MNGFNRKCNFSKNGYTLGCPQKERVTLLGDFLHSECSPMFLPSFFLPGAIFCSIKNLHLMSFERMIYRVTIPRCINSASFLPAVQKQNSFCLNEKFTQLKAIFRWKGNLSLKENKYPLKKGKQFTLHEKEK